MSDPTRRTKVPLSKVRTDGTQCRVETYDVSEMAAEIREEGCVRQAIVVFHDGEHYWVGDGHHRTKAAREAGLTHISAAVHEGGQRQAWLYALGANDGHGHRRTNADKRNSVVNALSDPELSEWSDNEIARQCRVSQPFVGKVRSELSYNGYKIEGTRKVRRGDTVYDQNTSKRGKGTKYHCSECGEECSVPVWHCQRCGRHEKDGCDACGGCYAPRTPPQKRLEPSKQPELPGTTRAQAVRYGQDPETDSDERDEIVEALLAEGIRDTEPINKHDRAPVSPSASWFDQARGVRSGYGSLDESNAVLEVIEECNQFIERINQKFNSVDPRHLPSVRNKTEGVLLKVIDRLFDLTPPDGKVSAQARAKFGVIQGGRS